MRPSNSHNRRRKERRFFLWSNVFCFPRASCVIRENLLERDFYFRLRFCFRINAFLWDLIKSILYLSYIKSTGTFKNIFKQLRIFFFRQIAILHRPLHYAELPCLKLDCDVCFFGSWPTEETTLRQFSVIEIQ